MPPAWKCKSVTFSVLDINYLTLSTLLQHKPPSVYFSFSFIPVIVGKIMQYPQYRDGLGILEIKEAYGRSHLMTSFQR